MSATGRHILLDATDQRKRLVQHGAVLLAIVALLVARVAVAGNFEVGLGLIGVGVGLFVLAATTAQRWKVEYGGHDILFENNPLRGEKLFVDGRLVAKGKFGVTSEMRAAITSGGGIGDEIVVRSTAGLLTFRCVIEIVPAAGIPATDDQLLAEVRRRGLVERR